MTADVLRVAAVGDVSLNGAYARALARRGPGHPFGRLPTSWRDADLRLGNLESPLTGEPAARPGKLALRAAPGAEAALRAAGFDCLTLANNHAMDFGPAGLAETAARLDAAGIAHVGAGADADAAAAPRVLDVGGRSVGVVASSLVSPGGPTHAGPGRPGVAGPDPEALVDAARRLRPGVDWLIAQVHWGREMERIPAPAQRDLARRLADAGADLVLGHHPHVLQPWERVGRAGVCYSLGNFAFSGMYWRGRNKAGEAFAARLQVAPLSRLTGWAEVTLRRGAPPSLAFRPARIGRDLATAPDGDPARARDWDEQGRRLGAADYAAEHAAEALRGEARRRSMYGAGSWARAVEVRLFRLGLIPGAVVGS